MRTRCCPTCVSWVAGRVPKNEMAPKGQARAHILHPMHTVSFTSTLSFLNEIALTGQTFRQAASSQWRHWIGIVPARECVTKSRGDACSPANWCLFVQAAMHV